MENLSYPIGKFKKPLNITSEHINTWIGEIESLPKSFKNAVIHLAEEQLNTPYRPEGWTIRQVIHHVPDSHLNSYVRFHWTLTEDKPLIKAYNEADWAILEYKKEMDINISLDLLASIHKRWVALLSSLTDAQLNRTFIHPEDNNTYSLKEMIGAYAWHGNHHLAHIEKLKERKGWA